MSAANAHAPAAVPPDGNDTDDDDRICRYCLADASEGELISPCACKGGQRWVHTECLVSWQRSVLVTQPTHPAFYEDDVRQTICSVCRTPFNRPPPSRAELMASFTGPQLASLLAPGSLIVCERDTSAAMLRTIALSEHLGRRHSLEHWVRSAYAIVEVDPSGASHGDDAIVAVNLTRQLDSARLPGVLQSMANRLLNAGTVSARTVTRPPPRARARAAAPAVAAPTAAQLDGAEVGGAAAEGTAAAARVVAAAADADADADAAAAGAGAAAVAVEVEEEGEEEASEEEEPGSGAEGEGEEGGAADDSSDSGDSGRESEGDESMTMPGLMSDSSSLGEEEDEEEEEDEGWRLGGDEDEGSDGGSGERAPGEDDGSESGGSGGGDGRRTRFRPSQPAAAGATARARGGSGAIELRVLHFIGGPCSAFTPRALYRLRAPESSIDQRVLSRVSRLGLSGGAWFGGNLRAIGALARADAAACKGAGGVAEGASASGAALPGAMAGAPGAAVEGAPACERGMAGAEGGDAASAADWEPEVSIFWGEARWSRTQLLGELARGSWGMCRAEAADVFERQPPAIAGHGLPRGGVDAAGGAGGVEVQAHANGVAVPSRGVRRGRLWKALIRSGRLVYAPQTAMTEEHSRDGEAAEAILSSDSEEEEDSVDDR